MSKRFSRYKVNCSELPELMSREQGNTPPTEKDVEEFMHILEKDMIDITDRQKFILQQFVTKTINYDRFSLSATTKKALYRHYTYLMYGIGKVSLENKMPMQLEKGEIAEPSAIQLLSKLDGVQYKKNEELFSNTYFKGIPDIVLKGEKGNIIGVKDVKVSFDMPSFLERVDGDSVKDDRWEMIAYMDVLNLKEGELCYCLVNMPDQMKQQKLKDYEERLIVLGVEKDHIRKRLRKIEKSMVYDFLPPEKRVKRFVVHRKGYFTTQARGRVKLVRTLLEQLHNKFENSIILPEMQEPSQESIS